MDRDLRLLTSRIERLRRTMIEFAATTRLAKKAVETFVESLPPRAVPSKNAPAKPRPAPASNRPPG